MPELSEEERVTLGTAQTNMMLIANQGLHRLPTDFSAATPKQFEESFARTAGEVDVLLHHRAKVAALPSDGSQAAELQATLRNMDREIDRGLGVLRAYSAYSGATNDQQIAQLREVQRLAELHASSPGVPPESRRSALALRGNLQSEIYTRQGGISQLVVPPTHPEYEGNVQSVETAIQARQTMGQYIREDATAVLRQEPRAETQDQARETTRKLLVQHRALQEKMSPEAYANAQVEMNQIRMGTSDTIKGKSGGGEKEGGADQATRNWLQAAERASEIAQSGRPITLDEIRELNRILNQNMPANEGVAGEFRAKTETAGGGSQYPYPEHIGGMMEEFTQWFEQNQHRDPIELAGLAYQKLVSIHPFDDANGRTCRLVVDSILQSKGLPPASYVGEEVNVAAFGQPQGGKVNVTPDQAIQSVALAVERSMGVMQKHRLGIDQDVGETLHVNGSPHSHADTSHSHASSSHSEPGPSHSEPSTSLSHASSSNSQKEKGPDEEKPTQSVRDALHWNRTTPSRPPKHSEGMSTHRK